MKNFTLFFKQYLEEDTFSVTVSCLFWILIGFQSEIGSSKAQENAKTKVSTLEVKTAKKAHKFIHSLTRVWGLEEARASVSVRWMERLGCCWNWNWEEDKGEGVGWGVFSRTATRLRRSSSLPVMCRWLEVSLAKASSRRSKVVFERVESTMLGVLNESTKLLWPCT